MRIVTDNFCHTTLCFLKICLNKLQRYENWCFIVKWWEYPRPDVLILCSFSMTSEFGKLGLQWLFGKFVALRLLATCRLATIVVLNCWRNALRQFDKTTLSYRTEVDLIEAHLKFLGRTESDNVLLTLPDNSHTKWLVWHQE